MLPGFWRFLLSSDILHASSTASRLCFILTMCVRSWNLGSAHIISLSTEVYFYLQFGLELLFRQYEWLKQDLEVNDSNSYMR